MLVYLDLALQSFHDYYMIVTYYKDYMRDSDYQMIKTKTFIWIAKVLFKADELDDCQNVLNEVYSNALDLRG